MPWSDEPLAVETSLIRNQLAALNRAGFFTITSQPALKGIPSDHILFGWGGPGAYIHQRNYGNDLGSYFWFIILILP